MPLKQIVLDKIAANGAISIAEYMDLCLYHPQHGYYTKRNPLGKKGDFITAPELTPIFGETIAIWIVKTWENLGSPASFNLIEGGAGTGILIADITRTLQKISPPCATACNIWLLENSPTLRKIQSETLQNIPHVHASNIGELPANNNSVFIANELLDAFPIRQFAGDTEIMITSENSQLKRTATPTSESQEASNNFIKELNPKISAALIIDYAYTQGQGDTLQAMYKHQKVDIFHKIGETDITSHVNFAETAEAFGGNCQINDMAHFLLNYGIATRATQALETAPNNDAKQNIETAMQRLISPNEMGSLFKVLEWGTASSSQLPLCPTSIGE